MDWTALITALITSGIVSSITSTYFERRRQDRQERLATYKFIVDQFADFLNDFAFYYEHSQPITPEKISAFNKMRMQTYGYLCIYSNQESIDAHEALIEHIFETFEGKVEFNWSEVRNRVMRVLNSFRVDYDPALLPASYNGTR